MCMEDKFMEGANCILPWRRTGRVVTSEEGKKTCSTNSDLRRFKSFFHRVHVNGISKKSLYDATGCAYNCKYMVKDDTSI